jgi:hypothetical protein
LLPLFHCDSPLFAELTSSFFDTDTAESDSGKTARNLFRIILPEEIENLYIEPEQDMVTLMTCTPYGVNTHRLLIRSKRIDTKYQSHATVAADAVQLDPMLVVPCLSAPLLLGLFIFWGVSGKRNKRHFPHEDPLSLFSEEPPKKKKK